MAKKDKSYPVRRRREAAPVKPLQDKIIRMKARLQAVEGRIAVVETLMKIYDSQRREAFSLLGHEEE